MKKSNGDTKIGVAVILTTITRMVLSIVEIVVHVVITKEMVNMIASALKITPNIAGKIVQSAEDKQTAPSAHPSKQRVPFAHPLVQRGPFA